MVTAAGHALEARRLPAITIDLRPIDNPDLEFDDRIWTDLEPAYEERLAQDLGRLIDDELAAIIPSEGRHWTTSTWNPVGGPPIELNDLVVPANTLIIFIGFDDLPKAAGLGGPGIPGSPAAGSSRGWEENVRSRGQGNNGGLDHSDNGCWGGSVAVEYPVWPGTLAHEVLHGMGFGPSAAWKRHITGSRFTGPNARAVYGGEDVPLDEEGGSHWDQQIRPRSVMKSPHAADAPTALDLAALRDMGWEARAWDTVAIDDSRWRVAENAGSIDVTISSLGIDDDYSSGISWADLKDVDFTYTLAPKTAREGFDYQAVQGSFRFTRGPLGGPIQTTRTISIPILQDALDEGDETFELLLDCARPELLDLVRTATITIEDDDHVPTPGRFRFETETASLTEFDPARTIKVLRVDGGEGPASVALRVVGGTAAVNQDYWLFGPPANVLNFDPGQTEASFTLQNIGDFATEGDETILLALEQPRGGAELGSPSTMTVTIRDDPWYSPGNGHEPGGGNPPGPSPRPPLARLEPPDPVRLGRNIVALRIPTTGPPLAGATRTRHYRLTTPGRDRKFGTRDDVTRRLRTILYNPDIGSILLVIRGRLSTAATYQLRVTGLRDVFDRLVDGDGDAVPDPTILFAITNAKPVRRR